ncbi:MAG TPA: glycoside hydrolase family 127 protein, partial [Phycisphaerae bacterium]|nr:glycoside hydrolase family 127 protein [Phycisphaerae bacterium]
MRKGAFMVGLLVAGLTADVFAQAKTSLVDRPSINPPNAFHIGNREPLWPVPLVKLPIGAIEPRGWLRTQLQLEADGFSGRLTEISEFLKKENNAWLSPSGEGEHGWEEVPYWLRGFGDLGYVLRDERIITETRLWLEAVLAGQREDGYFGPRANLTRLDGKPDLWPNMIMLNALQSYYEYSGDERVLKFMTNYFRWQLAVPEEDFLVTSWQHQRAADNLDSVYWLYNRTGDAWLLDLAEKIHRRTANWTEAVANWHGVNIAQAFRGPAVYFQQSCDLQQVLAACERYGEVMLTYGQVPGGGFAAD